MLYHAGILTEGLSPTLERIKSQEWPSLPDWVRHDLNIAMLTPGFTSAWWSRALMREEDGVRNYRKAISESLIPQAIENYESITRDDCIRLAQFRGVKPIRVKIQIVEDIHNGMTWREAARVYRLTQAGISLIRKYPLLSSSAMPSWFQALIPGA